MYNPILKFSALFGQISNSSLKVDTSGTPNHDVVLMFLEKMMETCFFLKVMVDYFIGNLTIKKGWIDPQ